MLLELARANLIAANLVEEEIIGLRLFTGPLFMKINGSLHQVMENSAYSNVFHASCSGLTKLSTVARIPDWRTVYRGFGGMHLPSELEYEDANGAKGVCERGFLSTTTDMEVATSYVGKKEMPTIFSIECGAVDKGACISWLLQHPEDDEVLMLPRSHLEVVGIPVVRTTMDNVKFLEIPLRISCNLHMPTIENIRASRKTQLSCMLDHTHAEICRDLNALLNDAGVAQRATTDTCCAKRNAIKQDPVGNARTLTEENSPHNSGMVEGIKAQCATWIAAVRAHDATWFNVHANYERVMLEAFDLKRLALGKVELWRDDCGALAVLVNELSLCAAIQQTQSKKQRLYQVSKAVACANTCRPSVVTWWHGPRMAVSDTVRKLALQLCTDRGLLMAVVNDKLGETSLMRQVTLGAALESIILLVDAGEDPHAVDWQGATALHLAAQVGHTAIVVALISELTTVLLTREERQPSCLRRGVGTQQQYWN